MLAKQAICTAVLCGLLTLGEAASASSPHKYLPEESNSQVCGDQNTRLTICFPGSPDVATCVYSLVDNFYGSALPSQALQTPCPEYPILGDNCTSLLGTLYVAYGPCNSGDSVPPATASNSMPVSDWLDVLGVNSLEILGGLHVRGYAFQQSYTTLGIKFLPELHSFLRPTQQQLVRVEYFQMTVSGLAVPPIPKVESIEGGISILNSPDTDFTTPPRFTSLANLSQGIRLSGCKSLTSLAGLEKLAGGSGFVNIELINDLILSNITALLGPFQCQKNGSTLLDPHLVVGILVVHPLQLQSQNKGCALHSPGEICEYIAEQRKCPAGTEYIRYSDGTIEWIPSTPLDSAAPENAEPAAAVESPRG